MLKIECTEGRMLKERVIDFDSAIEILKDKVLNAKVIKTSFLIPNTKGVNLIQTTYWQKAENKDNYSYSMFNGSFIVNGKDDFEGIAFDGEANAVLRDRGHYFEVYFKDYNLSLIFM